MIRASVVGATGYTGRELLRWLLAHPQARIVHATSETSAGKAAASVHPELAGRTSLVLEKLDAARLAKDSDVVFLCLPHGGSARAGKKFLDHKVKVVDLSADFRLNSAALYKKWYGLPHPYPRLLARAVYGLPEVYREEIARADLIANPGCYAAASILAALPLVHKGLIVPGSIVIDAKSGVSGAGKKLELRYHFCEENENFLAYGVQGHRHLPEIEQELSGASGGGNVRLTFVPHLLPLTRGILVTLYAALKRKMPGPALQAAYARYYEGEPFVHVLPAGEFPQLKSVQHTNFCRIGVHVDVKNKRAIVIGALDNLGKGASSQAVQNMNLMFGLEERCGLV